MPFAFLGVPAIFSVKTYPLTLAALKGITAYAKKYANKVNTDDKAYLSGYKMLTSAF